MNKYIIITARCNSSRLKNKILKKITKKYKSIDILIRRAQKTNFPICLATTTNKSDDKLVNYVKKNYKIDIFRGSEGNKVLRWVKCIEKFNIDYAALVDGDDLAFDYTIYKNFLSEHDAFGGYLSSDFEEARLKLDMKPITLDKSEEGKEKGAIHFNFNFHHDLSKENRHESLSNYIGDWKKYYNKTEEIIEEL